MSRTDSHRILTLPDMAMITEHLHSIPPYATVAETVRYPKSAVIQWLDERAAEHATI